MKESNRLKNRVISGMVWKFLERIIAQGIAFLISIILARILMPEQYGTISLVLVFISIANVFVSSGLGESLIQKKDSDDVDFSTIFYCSLTIGLFLYGVLFLSAPLIADFYNDQSLTPVIRILSLQIPFASVKTIQHAYVSKHMMFRKFFYSTLIGTIISGVIGILMAYNGFGVWSLVFQYLINSIIDMTVLFFTVKWRPTLNFSLTSAKRLFSYGIKLMLAQLLNTTYNEARNLVIGRVYSKEDLANNSKGTQFPSLIIENVNTSISSVLFPTMSKVNDDMEALKKMTKTSIRVSCYIIFPMMIGMAAVASPLVKLLLTEKWIGCVPFLQMACIFWMFQPSLTANNQAIKAAGRSDICLKMEIVKKSFGFILIVGTMFINVYVLAFSNIVFAFFSMLVNMFPNKKIIKYGYLEQFKDMLPPLILSLVMGVAVFSVSFLDISDILKLLIQVPLGVGIYIAGSILFRFDSFKILLNYINSFFGKKEVLGNE